MASRATSNRQQAVLALQRRGLITESSQRRLLEALIRRHTRDPSRRPPPAPCTELALVQDATHSWLAGKEEIVVRADDAARADPILRRAGFRRADDGGFVARYARAAVPRRRLEDVVRRLRLDGISAGPNLVHATGQIKMKGVSAPARVARHLPPRPDSSKGARVKVAVIDTGIWAEAADRGDGWLDGIAAHPVNIDPLDAFSADGPGANGLLDWSAGHGTFVAGIIRQIAPAATVTVIRALDSAGLGTDAEVAEAIVAAASAGADIIHCSFAGPGFEGLAPIALSEAMRVADPDALIVAAAGNNGDADPMYPAAFKRVVAVGALTDEGAPAAFSSRGWWVDACAVGEGIVSTFVSGTEEPLTNRAAATWRGKRPDAVWSGTSFAAPQVTGAVAVRLAELRQRSRRATARAAFDDLTAGAEQIPGVGALVGGLVDTVPYKRTP